MRWSVKTVRQQCILSDGRVQTVGVKHFGTRVAVEKFAFFAADNAHFVDRVLQQTTNQT